MTEKKYLPTSFVLLTIALVIFALVPNWINIIYPDNVFFNIITTKPYSGIYLLALLAVGIFLERRIRKQTKMIKKQNGIK